MYGISTIFCTNFHKLLGVGTVFAANDNHLIYGFGQFFRFCLPFFRCGTDGIVNFHIYASVLQNFQNLVEFCLTECGLHHNGVFFFFRDFLCFCRFFIFQNHSCIFTPAIDADNFRMSAVTNDDDAHTFCQFIMNDIMDFFHKRAGAIQNFQPLCFRFIIQSFANAMGTNQKSAFCQSIQIFYNLQSFGCQVVRYGFIMNQLSIGI